MHNHLEKYLSKIEDQLAALPAEQRQEELREIRSHLKMMIDDNVARGCDENEAVAKAVEQFGAAKKVGHDLSFPPGSERSYLLKHMYKLFGMFAAIVAVDAMFYYFPSISLSFNNWWSLIVLFLLGWTSMFFAKRKTVSSLRICVIFCCITIIGFYGGSSGFTSPQDFNFAALFAGFLIGNWQKSRHSVVTN